MKTAVTCNKTININKNRFFFHIKLFYVVNGGHRLFLMFDPGFLKKIEKKLIVFSRTTFDLASLYQQTHSSRDFVSKTLRLLSSTKFPVFMVFGSAHLRTDCSGYNTGWSTFSCTVSSICCTFTFSWKWSTFCTFPF